MVDKPLYEEGRDYVRLAHHEASKRPYTSPFLKDYARVLHSAAFRRLQGKMQLFPVGYNSITRTRLTHSLEVAEIAIRISSWLNNNHDYFQNEPDEKGRHSYLIDRDLVAAAAISHDLGHPPFGHSGENALNGLMGIEPFEGNAQTLRILARLEQRLDSKTLENLTSSFQDHSYEAQLGPQQGGLDLCYRTLASVIKYDSNASEKKVSAFHNKEEKNKENVKNRIFKGYYREESELVANLKKVLMPSSFDNELRTIECQIMDIADDIAYSTYDLEDAMIVGLIKPFDVISCADEHLDKISEEVTKKMHKFGYDYRVDQKDALAVLMQVFSNILSYNNKDDYRENNILQRIAYVARSYRENLEHANNQPIRRRFMETLIEGAVRAVSVELDELNPMLSHVKIELTKFLEIECLKAFTFQIVTSCQSNMIIAHRSKKVVESLWQQLIDVDNSLLPDDIRSLFRKESDERKQNRMLCDLIATLTDTEAMDLYRKLEP
ncbi:dGTPase [Skermanella aerolata]|uniref:dGTP triphosphohydrolase n=1 Tax=Skermanella aerolata TaxID=393310 RepID=UPI003D1E2AE0